MSVLAACLILLADAIALAGLVMVLWVGYRAERAFAFLAERQEWQERQCWATTPTVTREPCDGPPPPRYTPAPAPPTWEEGERNAG